MNFLINALLGLTAFAPAGLVHGFSYLPNRPRVAAIVIGISVLVALFVPLVLRMGSLRNLEELRGEQTKPAGSDAAALFLTYALPLMAPISPEGHPYATIVFCTLLLIMIARSRLIAMNPVFLLLGYTMYEVEADSGITYYLLRRRSDYRLVTTEFKVARIGDVLFLEVRQ